MTRYNNLGLKRKYVQATQYREEEPEAGPSQIASSSAQDEHASNDQAQAAPQKKKRKRGKPRKSQVGGEGDVQAAGGEASTSNGDHAPAEGSTDKNTFGKNKPGTKAEKGKRKLKEKRGEYFFYPHYG